MAALLESELRSRQAQPCPARSAASGFSSSRLVYESPSQLWQRRVREFVAVATAPALVTPPASESHKRKSRSTLDDDLVDRYRAAGELAASLDLSCVASVLGSTPQRIRAAPQRAARLTVTHFVTWSAGYIRSAVNVLRRLRSFTARSKAIDGLTMAAFLDEVDQHAKAKKRRTRGSSTRPPPEVEGFFRSEAGGSTAAHGALSALRWLRANAGLELPLDAPALTRFRVSKAESSAASPSLCLSLRAVASLDAASKDEANGAFIQGHCAAWTFLHYSVSRLAQAQRATFVSDQDDVRTMVTALEKTPRLGRGRARAFWAPKVGIDGAGYLAIIDQMLDDLECPSFVLRDTDSVDGDPRKATKWVDAPCTGNRAVRSLRACLETIGMPAPEAAWYSPSCARHFLPLVARLRGETAERRNELGRWAGSSAAEAPMPSSEKAAAKSTRLSAEMPDRYAGAAIPAVVSGIIVAQISACRDVVQKKGLANLPMHGGFSSFAEA